MLNAYRAWTADWQVIITILGWLLVIGGIVRIVLPQVATMIAPAVYSGTTRAGDHRSDRSRLGGLSDR